jgi:hypothetical protein
MTALTIILGFGVPALLSSRGAAAAARALAERGRAAGSA